MYLDLHNTALVGDLSVNANISIALESGIHNHGEEVPHVIDLLNFVN